MKQNKVLSKIKYDSKQTTPSQTKNNDECYTPLIYISDELKEYPIKCFSNKNGISPFDWDIFDEYKNIFWKRWFYQGSYKFKL